MKQQSAELGGWSMNFTVRGTGTPVVLLHGFCGSSAYWDDLATLLEGTCRLILPDLRGHGQSGSPDEPYSIEAMADDIAGLLDSMEITKAIVLGHSLGGYITLALAERHQEKLLGFGLIHSTAYPDDEKAKEGRLKAIQTIREQGMPVFIEGLVPKLFAPAYLSSMPNAVSKAKTIGLHTSQEGAARTAAAMRERPDRNGVLRESQLPILLVAGTEDIIVPVERTFSVSGERIMQRKIDGAGHMSMMENPSELAKAITDFIATV